MSILGFPTSSDISEMFGYVTPEDRAKWDSQKEESDKQLDKARNGLTAAGLASKSTAPALGMAEKVISSRMTGAAMEERRNTQAKQTKRTVTTLETEEPVNIDNGMGY